MSPKLCYYQLQLQNTIIFSMISQFKTVLVLAPHTDDGEIGCGATINKLIEQGAEVHYVAFSAAEESVPEHLPCDILRTEVLNATEMLGISPQNISVLNYKVRYFTSNRQEILEDLVQLNNKVKPDLVLLPSKSDIHQDHHVISTEGIRAFKRVTILGYEIPWNNFSFNSTCFVCLEEKHLQAKINALKCYESQSHRSYVDKDFIKSWALTRGTQINKPYAELFEVIRWIIN